MSWSRSTGPADLEALQEFILRGRRVPEGRTGNGNGKAKGKRTPVGILLTARRIYLGLDGGHPDRTAKSVEAACALYFNGSRGTAAAGKLFPMICSAGGIDYPADDAARSALCEWEFAQPEIEKLRGDSFAGGYELLSRTVQDIIGRDSLQPVSPQKSLYDGLKLDRVAVDELFDQVENIVMGNMVLVQRRMAQAGVEEIELVVHGGFGDCRFGAITVRPSTASLDIEVAGLRDFRSDPLLDFMASTMPSMSLQAAIERTAVAMLDWHEEDRWVSGPGSTSTFHLQVERATITTDWLVAEPGSRQLVPERRTQTWVDPFDYDEVDDCDDGPEP